MGFINDMFTKVTKEDKAMFYTFERIYELAPRHYFIYNCTKGFMVLMKKSKIDCDVMELNRRVETKGHGRFDIECTTQSMADMLTQIMKKGRY